MALFCENLIADRSLEFTVTTWKNGEEEVEKIAYVADFTSSGTVYCTDRTTVLTVVPLSPVRSKIAVPQKTNGEKQHHTIICKFADSFLVGKSTTYRLFLLCIRRTYR